MDVDDLPEVTPETERALYAVRSRGIGLRRRRRAAMAGASLAVTAGLIAGVVVANRTGDNPPRLKVLAGSGRGTGSRGPTGWYAPTALPDGWRVTSVRLVDPGPATGADRPANTDPDRPCACESAVWVSEDGQRGIVATTEPGRSPDVFLNRYPAGSVITKTIPVKERQGVVASPRFDTPEPGRALRLVTVSDGKRVLRLAGQERDQGVMEAMAADWVFNQINELLSDVSQPKGWALTSRGSTRAAQHAPFVRVTLATNHGPAHFDLVPPGSRPFDPIGGGDLPGTPGPVLLSAGGAERSFYPAAEVIVGVRGPRIRQAELNKVLVGVLRPATADQWRRFLRRVDHDPATNQPSLSQAGGPTAIADSSSADLGSQSATTLPSRWNDIDGLSLTLDLWQTAARAGDPIGADLLVRNTSDQTITLTECNQGSVQWTLLPEDDIAGPIPIRSIIDCYDTPRTVIPGGSIARLALRGGFVTQASASEKYRTAPFGPPLPAGTYRAVATMDGSDSELRVVDPRPIQVSANDCPPQVAPFVVPGSRNGSAVGSVKEARAAAGHAGLTLRTLAVGDDPGPPDCGRITAYVDPESAQIMAFTRS